MMFFSGRIYHTFFVSVTEPIDYASGQSLITAENIPTLRVPLGTRKVKLGCSAYEEDNESLHKFSSSYIDWIFTRKELQVQSITERMDNI